MDECEYIERCKLVPLTFWLDAAQRAGLNVVPATASPRFKLREAYHFLDAEEVSEAKEAYEAIRWVENELDNTQLYGSKPVVRWESASPTHIKVDCSEGKGYQESWRDIVFDDMRLIDMPPFGCTIPDQDGRTCFYVRPYIEPMVIDGYPVEFRYFQNKDGTCGVSSYYPQRSLRPTNEIMRYVAQVILAGNALARQDEFFYGFTADFLIDVAGRFWFLEGGPPHGNGAVSAHMCCFEPGQTRGLALTPGATVAKEVEAAKEVPF